MSKALALPQDPRAVCVLPCEQLMSDVEQTRHIQDSQVKARCWPWLEQFSGESPLTFSRCSSSLGSGMARQTQATRRKRSRSHLAEQAKQVPVQTCESFTLKLEPNAMTGPRDDRPRGRDAQRQGHLAPLELICPLPSEEETRRKDFKDFNLKAKARTWP